MNQPAMAVALQPQDSSMGTVPPSYASPPPMYAPPNGAPHTPSLQAPAYPPSNVQFQPQQPSYTPQPQAVQNTTQIPPTYQQSQQPLAPPGQINPYHQQQLNQIIQALPPEKLTALQQTISQPPYQQQPQAPPPQQFPQFATQQQPLQQQWPAPPPSNVVYTPPESLFSFGSKPKPFSPLSPTSPKKDEKQTGKVQRFLGDTLVGRFARASVQTASSALKMPAALSPWGDNNPVTLPNVRYRDAVLFTTFAFVGAPLIEGADSVVTDVFGADSFVAEIVSSGAGTIVGSTVLKYGVFQIVEQAIDKGIVEHMLPEEERLVQTVNVKSLQVAIKHKLMNVDADIRFSSITAAQDPKACFKGWFCPYLFASARTPLIPRANDFSVAQFFGPFVAGDYAMAHKLVSESTHVMSMCDPDPKVDIGTNRLVVVFTGISPFRAGMWSTSRRPGCGTLVFHLFDGCPALVLPVTSRAPIVGWSPWTWDLMRKGAYSAEVQHEQICEWLDTVVSMQHVKPQLQERYVDILGRAVSLIINGALALEKVQDKTVLGKVDPERSGIVMFRY